jgi:hypothetical protein
MICDLLDELPSAMGDPLFRLGRASVVQAAGSGPDCGRAAAPIAFLADLVPVVFFPFVSPNEIASAFGMFGPLYRRCYRVLHIVKQINASTGRPSTGGIKKQKGA